MWLLSAVSLVILHLVAADYSSAVGPSGYGRQQSSYRLLNAGRSHQFSWIGSGRHIPRRVPRPPQLPRFIWMGRPMYNALWVPKIPSSSSGNYGKPRPASNSNYGGVSVLGGSSDSHSSSSHSSSGHSAGSSQGYSQPPSVDSQQDYGAPRGAISGGPVESYSAPSPQNSYSSPQPAASYESPKAESGYSAPQVEETYSAPQPNTGSQAVDNHQSFSAPQVQETFQAPQTQQSYSAPETQQTYSAPQSQQGYASSQEEGSYSAQELQNVLSSPQVDESYGAPETQQSYSAPQEQIFSAPQQSYSEPQVEQSYSQPQQEYTGPTQVNTLFSPSQPDPSYGSPHSESIIEPSSQPQGGYTAPPQPLEEYGSPVNVGSQNNYEDSIQPQSGFSLATSYQSGAFEPAQSIAIPDSDYGAPKDDTLIDYTSAQRYETAEIVPQTSPISSSRAVDPSSYGQPKANSILGSDAPQSYEPAEYQAPAGDSIAVSDSLDQGYGAPKSQSLVGGQQEYAGSVQQYDAVEPPSAIAAEQSFSTPDDFSNGYSTPDEGSIISYEAVQNVNSGYPQQGLSGATSKSDENQRYEAPAPGYADISPDSIITLESLQSQNSPNAEDVFVNIRGSFDYNEGQQTQNLNQGYGAPLPSDVVENQYAQSTVQSPSTALSAGSVGSADSQQNRYYDLQYPQASQYQEEFYRPNQIDDLGSNDVVEIVSLVEEPFRDDLGERLDEYKADNDLISVDLAENQDEGNQETDIAYDIASDIANPIEYEQSDILDNSFNQQPLLLYDTKTDSVDFPFVSEPDQELTESFIEELSPYDTVELNTEPTTTTAATEISLETAATTEPPTTIIDTTTETTLATTTQRRQRPFFNLPTRRPYFSSFYQRRRASRRSTTTTESTPEDKTEGANFPEENTSVDSTENSTASDDQETTEEISQEQAIQSRLEEIRERRKRPIPFGARLRPKLQRYSAKSVEEQ